MRRPSRRSENLATPPTPPHRRCTGPRWRQSSPAPSPTTPGTCAGRCAALHAVRRAPSPRAACPRHPSGRSPRRRRVHSGENDNRGGGIVLERNRRRSQLPHHGRRQRIDPVASVQPHHGHPSLRTEALLDGHGSRGHVLISSSQNLADVIPGLVPGIHPSACCGAHGALDPDNKRRDDKACSTSIPSS